MSGAGRALAVEFLGLPGVGKSTISRTTAEQLAHRGLAVREPVRALSDRSGPGPSLRGYLGKSLLIARELCTHPGDSYRSIRAIHATAQPSFPVLLKVTANWLMQCSLLRNCRKVPAVHLLDEGMFQALWSIGLEGRPGAVSAVAGTLAAACLLPDGVAVVEADLESVALRLEKRGGRESRADHWRRDDVRALNHASALMLEVIEVLTGVDQQRRRPWVIHVRNGSPGDLAIAARQLAAEIERCSLSEPPDDRTLARDARLSGVLDKQPSA